MAAATSSSERSMRMYGKIATMPAKFSKRDRSDILLKRHADQAAIPAEQLIDLSYLTDQERLTIERVIQKDLKLRRTILG